MGFGPVTKLGYETSTGLLTPPRWRSREGDLSGGLPLAQDESCSTKTKSGGTIKIAIPLEKNIPTIVTVPIS